MITFDQYFEKKYGQKYTTTDKVMFKNILALNKPDTKEQAKQLVQKLDPAKKELFKAYSSDCRLAADEHIQLCAKEAQDLEAEKAKLLEQRKTILNQQAHAAAKTLPTNNNNVSSSSAKTAYKY